jgi:hypothetical protein
MQLDDQNLNTYGERGGAGQFTVYDFSGKKTHSVTVNTDIYPEGHPGNKTCKIKPLSAEKSRKISAADINNYKWVKGFKIKKLKINLKSA